jgi:hypothetical protein
VYIPFSQVSKCFLCQPPLEIIFIHHGYCALTPLAFSASCLSVCWWVGFADEMLLVGWSVGWFGGLVVWLAYCLVC